jgi:hypothetical protein
MRLGYGRRMSISLTVAMINEVSEEEEYKDGG